MVSIINVNGQVYTKDQPLKVRSRQEVYCDAEDLGEDMAGAPTNVPNGTPLYIMDWDELDSGTQTKLKSQIYIFSAGKQRWIPQL